jgi:hypothetical protein
MQRSACGMHHAAMVCEARVTFFCDDKLANRNVRDFGWEIAHAAVSRRPPISFPLHCLYPDSHIHVRRESLGSVHHSKAIFCRPAPNVTIRNFLLAVVPGLSHLRRSMESNMEMRSVRRPPARELRSSAESVHGPVMRPGLRPCDASSLPTRTCVPPPAARVRVRVMVRVRASHWLLGCAQLHSRPPTVMAPRPPLHPPRWGVKLSWRPKSRDAASHWL